MLLPNRARLGSDLESIGCLDIAEELIKKMMGGTFYSDVAQRVIVQALAVIENAKLQAHSTYWRMKKNRRV